MSIRIQFVAMAFAPLFAVPAIAEGIASIVWIAPENVSTLPRHHIAVSCVPDPKNSNLLHVRLTFNIESGHKLHDAHLYMRGADATTSEPGEQLVAKLAIDDNLCSFTVSKRLLKKIEIGYLVSENSYSNHVLAINGSELPNLATIADSSGADAPPVVTKSAEHAGAEQPATKPADKPPLKDQPSPPTPKNSPR